MGVNRELNIMLDEVIEKHVEIMELWIDMLEKPISSDEMKIVINNLETLTKVKAQIETDEYLEILSNRQ